VGAPEALVIGVVALLVFGPKGLADIAKQLGQTLRAFQPTIKELQEVSREFRDTLEDEIGLDEIRNDIAGVTAPVPTKRQAPAPDPVSADTAVSAPSAPSADESENTVTEEMRAQAAAAAWGGDEPEQPAAPVEPTAAVTEVPSELSAPEPAEPAAPEPSPAGEEKA
jgi:TatA/E family protein of Tat protein translocase